MDLFPPGVLSGAVRAAMVILPVFAVLFAVRVRVPTPIGGWLAVAAGTVALGVTGEGVLLFAAGALMAGLGGWLGVRRSGSLWVRALLVVPGATVAVVAIDDGGPRWMIVAGIVAASIAGVAADTVDRRFGADGLTLSMASISAVGVYVTVPETGLIIPAAAALCVLAVFGWPLAVMRLGPGGGSAVVTFLAALTVNGGWTRPGAIIGGLAVPGLLALLVAVPRQRSDDAAAVNDPAPVRNERTATLLALHVVVTLAVARIAGLRPDAFSALLLVGVFLGAGWWGARRVLASGT